MSSGTENRERPTNTTVLILAVLRIRQHCATQYWSKSLQAAAQRQLKHCHPQQGTQPKNSIDLQRSGSQNGAALSMSHHFNVETNLYSKISVISAVWHYLSCNCGLLRDVSLVSQNDHLNHLLRGHILPPSAVQSPLILYPALRSVFFKVWHGIDSAFWAFSEEYAARIRKESQS